MLMGVLHCQGPLALSGGPCIVVLLRATRAPGCQQLIGCVDLQNEGHLTISETIPTLQLFGSAKSVTMPVNVNIYMCSQDSMKKKS